MELDSLALAAQQKIYFASDFHLGIPSVEASRDRERKIVRWLEEAAKDADHIFLLGDVFDFWFEYRKAVPRGFTRLLGKLAELSDAGISLYMFTGNHDIWMWDYFPTELQIPVFHKPLSFTVGQHRFHVGHGDGLGPGDHTFKAMKKVFRNPLFQWLYARLHPNLGLSVGQRASYSSRLAKEIEPEDMAFFGKQEWLVQYCEQMEQSQPHDFYVFGHRHLPMDLPIGAGARYLNLGEWVHQCTYAVYDGESLQLKAFEQPLPELPAFEE